MNEPIHYGLWEDNLTIGKFLPTGQYIGFRLRDDGEWHREHPAELLNKPGMISEKQFMHLLPKGTKLPVLEIPD